MLSILVLNQVWLVDELRALGHRVVTAGWLDSRFDVHLKSPLVSVEDIVKDLPSGFVPDRVVYFDDSAPVGVVGLEHLGIPCLYYSVDAHHHSYWHRYFGAIFDLVLVAQKDYSHEFLKFNNNVKWFPLWASRIVKPEEPKTIDACFRGNLDPKLHPKRAEFFDALREKVSIDAGYGAYEVAYPVSKIVLNEAVNNDVNFRVFEALVCGAMVITPEVGNGFSELFADGEDLVTYPPGDVDAAAAKISYYLEHEEERLRIASTGHRKVMELHTPTARAKDLSDHLVRLELRPKPIKFTSIALSYLICSKIYRKVSESLADRILRFAADAFLEAVEDEAEQSQEYENGVVICVHYLKQRGFDDDARVLLRTIWDKTKLLTLVAFYHLDQLLEDKHVDEAMTVAGQLSSDPETLMAHVPSVVNETRERLLQNAPLD